MVDYTDPYFSEYQDRGIKKWSGFFLSEHTAMLAKEQEKNKRMKRLPQLNQEQIDDCLDQSIKYNKLLAIQLNSLDELGHVKQSISGIFQGFIDSETILISGVAIEYSDIRHIQMTGFSKWFDVRSEEKNAFVISDTPQHVDEFSEDYFNDGDFIG